MQSTFSYNIDVNIEVWETALPVRIQIFIFTFEQIKEMNALLLCLFSSLSIYITQQYDGITASFANDLWMKKMKMKILFYLKIYVQSFLPQKVPKASHTVIKTFMHT